MSNIGNFADELIQELQRYANVVAEDVDAAAEEVANELVDELKTTNKHKDVTGAYRKGWRVKNVRGKRVVHNKTDYHLTHLIEHGHAKIGGGRTESFPHIRPAEERAINEFLSRIDQAVRQ